MSQNAEPFFAITPIQKGMLSQHFVITSSELVVLNQWNVLLEWNRME